MKTICDEYKQGETIYHRHFGEGVVLVYEFEKVSEEIRAVAYVDFGSHGKKKIIAKPEYLFKEPVAQDYVDASVCDQPNVLHQDKKICVESKPVAGLSSEVLNQPDANPPKQRSITGTRRNALKILGGLLAAAPAMASSFTAPKTKSKTLPVLEATIAGFSYYRGDRCLSSMKNGDALTLKREPNNEHDVRAIEVYWKGQKIGYVPRIHNAALSKLIDSGELVTTTVTSIKFDEKWRPLAFEVRVLV